MAGPQKTAWVQATWISLAPRSLRTRAAPQMLPGGADHVVEHQHDLAFDGATDDVFLDGVLGAGAAFVDDRDRAAKSLGVAKGPLDAPFVGTSNHQTRRLGYSSSENAR